MGNRRLVTGSFYPGAGAYRYKPVFTVLHRFTVYTGRPRMEAKMKYSDVREWIGSALDLSGHADGTIHAAADGTMAIGMQQGPREEQQDCGAALFCSGCLAGFFPSLYGGGRRRHGRHGDGGWASRRVVEIVVERCLSDERDTPRYMLVDALYHAQARH